MKSIPEMLRWACVLPAAAIIGIAVYLASGILSLIVATAWGTGSESAWVYWVQLTILYLPKKAAFVIGGALTAPRYRVATSLVLATAAATISLIVHILAQRTVGMVNYSHFAAESAGAACGVVCIAIVPRLSPSVRNP